MKEKRKAHQNYIQSKATSEKCLNLDQSEIKSPIFEASEDVLVSLTTIFLNLNIIRINPSIFLLHYCFMNECISEKYISNSDKKYEIFGCKCFNSKKLQGKKAKS